MRQRHQSTEKDQNLLVQPLIHKFNGFHNELWISLQIRAPAN
jgi:hypothetical protein